MKRQPSPPSSQLTMRPIRLNANGIGIALMFITITRLVVQSLMEILKKRVPLTGDPYIREQLVNMTKYVLPFVVAIGVGCLLTRIPRQRAFPFRPVSGAFLLATVGISMGASLLAGLLQNYTSQFIRWASGYVPIAPSQSLPHGQTALILYFINVAILPALLEEMLFRGVILQTLRRYGDGFALVISALLFAIGHGNLVQMPYTLVMGLLMGYFVLHSGSLIPGVAIHFVNNGLSVAMDIVTRSTTQGQDTVIYYLYFFIKIVVGITSLIYLRRKKGSLFYIPESSYPLKEREKYRAFLISPGFLVFLVYYVYQFGQYMVPELIV